MAVRLIVLPFLFFLTAQASKTTERETSEDIIAGAVRTLYQAGVDLDDLLKLTDSITTPTKKSKGNSDEAEANGKQLQLKTTSGESSRQLLFTWMDDPWYYELLPPGQQLNPYDPSAHCRLITNCAVNPKYCHLEEGHKLCAKNCARHLRNAPYCERSSVTSWIGGSIKIPLPVTSVRRALGRGGAATLSKEAEK